VVAAFGLLAGERGGRGADAALDGVARAFRAGLAV
jgi:hypothetical protein